MFVIDQLSRGDRQIRNISILVLSGISLLIIVLWHLQIFSSEKYIQQLERQSYRTVRVPAPRGQIIDRNGIVLATSNPSYSINLYIGDLSKAGLFKQEYKRLKGLSEFSSLSIANRSRLARFNVVSNTLLGLEDIIGTKLFIDEEKFNKHYVQMRALPLNLIQNASPQTVARFMESPSRPIGVGIESEPYREYPLHEICGHVLGFLTRRELDQGEINYNYQMPDFVGMVGIEGGYDKQLRGMPGTKSVLVDNTGYRQEENSITAAVAGQDVVLTIDSRIQSISEKALKESQENVKGAVVVMDVRNGDILSLVSAPSYDPNLFIPRISAKNWAIYNDENTMPTLCRATYGAYAPGSIFKVIVGLAALEAGIDPKKNIYCDGYYKLANRRINDTAPAGEYDFRRAFLRSSNAYFINVGLEIGLNHLLDMGNRFFLGKKIQLPTMQEVSGFFPDLAFIDSQRKRGVPWLDGHTANLCIGQGDITVTPLQMAVMTSAIANGGIIFWPRLVMRYESRDPHNKLAGEVYPSGKIRGHIGVAPNNLKVVQDSMLADVEDREGTGSKAAINGLRICGKTGTAEVKKSGKLVRKDTWFISYAPYENPRYAVVVLVEGGGSGGGTCAPVARKIYQGLLSIESKQSGAKVS